MIVTKSLLLPLAESFCPWLCSHCYYLVVTVCILLSLSYCRCIVLSVAVSALHLLLLFFHPSLVSLSSPNSLLISFSHVFSLFSLGVLSKTYDLSLLLLLESVPPPPPFLLSHPISTCLPLSLPLFASTSNISKSYGTFMFLARRHIVWRAGILPLINAAFTSITLFSLSRLL